MKSKTCNYSLRTDSFKANRISRTFLYKGLAYLLFTYLLRMYFGAAYSYFISGTETSLVKIYYKFFHRCVLPFSVYSICFFAVLYYFKFPFFEKYRINNAPFPWEENPQGWKKIVKDCVKVSLFNQMVIFPLGFLIITHFFRPDISAASAPSFATFLWQLQLTVLMDDFFIYWAHRLLHQPAFYSRMHKMHHEFTCTIHIAATYTHWSEFLVANVFPLFSTLMMLGQGMHIITLASYTAIRLVGTYESHSGYEFPWSPVKFEIFTCDPGFHNHHHLKNIGNYGSRLWIWDYLFRTSEHFYDHVKHLNNH